MQESVLSFYFEFKFSGLAASTFTSGTILPGTYFNKNGRKIQLFLKLYQLPFVCEWLSSFSFLFFFLSPFFLLRQDLAV